MTLRLLAGIAMVCVGTSPWRDADVRHEEALVRLGATLDHAIELW
jgi:hypothetical protein